MSGSTLTFADVHRAFGAGRRERHAVAGVSFSVEPGEIVGLVGPNGAGKTTLLRLAAGDLAPSVGDVLVGVAAAGTRAARRAVGLAADPPRIPPEVTGIEWLTYLASHRAPDAATRVEFVRAAVAIGRLGRAAGRRVGVYSRGTVKRLALAAATLGAPSLILLDETLSGIDPLISRDLRPDLAALAHAGSAFVIASDELATLERLVTRVLVLANGRLVGDVALVELLDTRIAELALNGGALTAAPWLIDRFRGTVRTGEGVAVPLRAGLRIEQVLAACRERRIAVVASRIRYPTLEDLVVRAVRGTPQLVRTFGSS